MLTPYSIEHFGNLISQQNAFKKPRHWNRVGSCTTSTTEVCEGWLVVGRSPGTDGESTLSHLALLLCSVISKLRGIILDQMVLLGYGEAFKDSCRYSLV